MAGVGSASNSNSSGVAFSPLMPASVVMAVALGQPSALHGGVRLACASALFSLAMDPKLIVHADPEILGGTPVFVGTRVPVQALLDYLEGGDTIEEFLDDYPGVSREQAVAFLEEAGRALLAQIA